MTDLELGYIVGLFEGEGFIAFNYAFRKDKYQREYYTVHVGIVNTNLETLQKVNILVGFGSITSKIVKKEHKPCWNWRTSNQKEVLSFLEKVYPYLIIKKEKADLVMEFLRLRIACNPNAKANCQRKYTDYERGFYNRYRNLKSFSKNKEVHHSLPI